MSSNCTAQDKPKRFEQPYFSATAFSFLACDKRGRVDGCSREVPQHVNAYIRHVHREHSAYSNPTCALHAPFVLPTFHVRFDLCRAREVNAQTPNERNGDSPSVLTKLPPRAQCMCVT